jgi:ABC-2 type transport system ATP-binding protein
LFGSARFEAVDSPRRKFLGPWCATNALALQPNRTSAIMTVVSALEVRGLTKRFDRPAVDALDLTVHAGEFYALLGPNGAGKTTTLRMVAGLLRPDAGSVTISGIDALADPVAA